MTGRLLYMPADPDAYSYDYACWLDCDDVYAQTANEECDPVELVEYELVERRRYWVGRPDMSDVIEDCLTDLVPHAMVDIATAAVVKALDANGYRG